MSDPQRRTAALVVVAAACLAYASTIDNYFVQDDFGVVSLLSQKPALYFPRWFVSTWMDGIWGYTPDEIRPFPAVSYQLAAIWGASSTVANHVLNIAFHAGNGLLVLAIGLEAAALSTPAAMVAALVFVLLPVQSESVAWITGRVDSMPAFFYLATFLAWTRWRASGRARAYAASVALFFVALFCKQNTITMAPALMLYDAIVPARHRFAGGRSGPSPVGSGGVIRRLWRWGLPYAPFVALTAGYLALRFVLFGEVAREDQLNAQTAGFFTAVVARHLRRLVLGNVAAKRVYWIGAVVALAAVGLVARRSAIDRRTALRMAIYFGIVWIVLGVAPVAVAGYESPRHIYLASVGWAIAIGLAFDVVRQATPARGWRVVATLAAVALLSVYSVQLAREVRSWNRRAMVSRLAAADLRREGRAAPEGTLLIAGAPRQSWEWAIPFVARPPYADTDMTRRLLIVSPWLLHCCRSDWEEYTRTTLRAWASRADRTPIVALYWDERTGDLSKLTDADEPSLRAVVPLLLGTDGHESLDEAMMDMLRDLVSPHRIGR